MSSKKTQTSAKAAVQKVSGMSAETLCKLAQSPDVSFDGE
jgi:hypothetical protein